MKLITWKISWTDRNSSWAVADVGNASSIRKNAACRMVVAPAYVGLVVIKNLIQAKRMFRGLSFQGQLLNTRVGLCGTFPLGIPLRHPRIAVVGSACPAVTELVRFRDRPILFYVGIGFNWCVRGVGS